MYADISSMNQRRAAASLIHLPLLLRQVRHGSRRRTGQSGRLRRERRRIWRLVETGVLAAEVAGELVVEDVAAALEQEAGAAGVQRMCCSLTMRSLAMISAGPSGHRGLGETADSRQITRASPYRTGVGGANSEHPNIRLLTMFRGP